jgi:hypothetical protein
LRVTKRIAALTLATTATATGLVFTGTVPAFAASNPTTFAVGPNTSHSGCAVALFYSRVSASTPADVSADVDSTHPGHTCTAWVERSGTKATKWTVASAKSALPSVGGLTGVANTGLVYDGPGYKARACVQAAGSSTVTCTSAMSLAKGSGTATSPALSASYERGTASVFRVTSSGIGGVCVGLVASTTTKKTGAKVVGLLASLGDPCTAWIQTSANRGKTWTTVSPVVSYKSATKTGEGAAFTAHYADNPGHLARICVKDLTSKQQNCSGGW